MVTEEERKDALLRMFLSYCRKTLLNARTDILRERTRMRKREVLFSDLPKETLDALMAWQQLPDEEVVFNVFGKPIGVADDALACALACLVPEEQAIVLLSYFAGWSDRRIGEELGFPRSTVQHRRARALARLGGILTEGGIANDKKTD